MGEAITQLVTLESISCGECGILYAMPDWKLNRLRETGEGFFCPNGHNRIFTETTVNKLRKQLESQTREATRQAERALKAEKEVKRLNKRTSLGVCPCCKRTFSQLARHMKSKHPKFIETNR